MSVALIDDLRPDISQDEQLPLDPAAFPLEPIRAFAQEGALTAVSLDLSVGEDEVTFETYIGLGTYLGIVSRATMWWVGDWLVYGEGRFGERWSQALDVTGLSEQTLVSRMYVARNVPPDRRRVGLAYSVHQVVAPLGAREQKTWLDRAAKNHWNAKQLRDAMKAKRKDEAPPLIDDETTPLAPEIILEAARAVVGSAVEYGDGGWVVGAEAMARLRAAVGMEE